MSCTEGSHKDLPSMLRRMKAFTVTKSVNIGVLHDGVGIVIEISVSGQGQGEARGGSRGSLAPTRAQISVSQCEIRVHINFQSASRDNLEAKRNTAAT